MRTDDLAHPVRRALGAGVVAAVLVLASASASAATDDASPQLLTVEGTVVNVAVEPAVEGQVVPSGDGDGGLEVVRVVEVDGELYPVPEDVPVAPAATGDAVEITIEADADLTVEQALEIATQEGQEPGVAQAPAPSEDEAEVVEVEVAAQATDEVLLAAPLGSHSLTVLPVYWGTGGDGTTKAALASLAAQTGQYWAEQSGGRISISSSSRDWRSIPAPAGGCSTTDIMNSALRAHGVAAPSGNAHVLVYFPQQASCGGWAGMASIGGGTIWVNGTPLVDVFAHEFGHNLGLGHANTATCTSGGARVPYAGTLSSCSVREYYDSADVMGYATRSVTGNLNTAMADHLGLVQVVRPTAGTPVTVDLAPLADVAATRSIAIAVADGVLYVDFRPATGRDVRQPAWAGVQVHLRTMDGVYRYPKTYLLDMKAPSVGEFSSPSLAPGASWAVPGTGLVVTVQSVGTTARVVVGPPGATPAPPPAAPPSTGTGSAASPVQRYIESVYRDLFERTVDAGGLQTWSSALVAGTPRVAVANSITYSQEYRSRLITTSYQTYLGRSPEPAGLDHWLGMMGSGWTIQQMEGGFLASPEYYARAGGNDAGWVSLLYADVLGRTASPSEVTYWVQRLAAGHDRFAVAMGFLLSTEHLTTVIDGYYVHLLGRHIDPVGRDTWVGLIQRGHRVEEIIGGIVASDEYYARG